MLFSFKTPLCFLLEFTKIIQTPKVFSQNVWMKAVHLVSFIHLNNFPPTFRDFSRKIPVCHVVHINGKWDVGAEIQKVESDAKNQCHDKGEDGFLPEFGRSVGVLVVNCWYGASWNVSEMLSFSQSISGRVLLSMSRTVETGVTTPVILCPKEPARHIQRPLLAPCWFFMAEGRLR